MVPNWKDKTINFDLAIAMKYGNKHLKMAKIQVFNVLFQQISDAFLYPYLAPKQHMYNYIIWTNY